MPTCLECRWFKRPWLFPNNLGRCVQPDVLAHRDPSGLSGYGFAEVERTYEHLPCGPKGRKFEQKER